VETGNEVVEERNPGAVDISDVRSFLVHYRVFL
jgi:hypothetical protein